MDPSKKKISEAFGVVLREKRLLADLSQEKLALDCGLDRTYISLLERGLRQPTLCTLFQLASILGVKPSEMVVAVERSSTRSFRNR